LFGQQRVNSSTVYIVTACESGQQRVNSSTVYIVMACESSSLYVSVSMWETEGASCTQTQELGLYRQLNTAFRLVAPV